MADDDSGYDLGDSRSVDSAPSSSRPAKKQPGKTRSAIGDAGKDLNERSVSDLRDQAREAAERITSFKRGGTKRGAGAARLHKDERIMAPKRSKKRRMGRKGGR